MDTDEHGCSLMKKVEAFSKVQPESFLQALLAPQDLPGRLAKNSDLLRLGWAPDGDGNEELLIQQP